jgi:membrane-associated protein
MIFWLVVALAGTVLLAVVGAIVFSLLNKDGALGLIADLEDEVAAYLAVFGLVFADAIVPIFPGETTLTTASIAASQDKLELTLVIVAGALGAVLGDSALYWIARTGPKKLKSRLEAAAQKDERVARGLALLGRSALLIACGRFVPGVRFAVNVSMGLTEYPYRRFLLFSAIGGAAWAIYPRPRLLDKHRARRLPTRFNRDLRHRDYRPRRRRLLARPPPSFERRDAGHDRGA